MNEWWLEEKEEKKISSEFFCLCMAMKRKNFFFPILSFISTKLICFFFCMWIVCFGCVIHLFNRDQQTLVYYTPLLLIFFCSFSFFKYSRIVFFFVFCFSSDFQPFFLTMVVMVVIFFKCPVHYTHYSLRFTEFCFENVWQPLSVCVCTVFFQFNTLLSRI